MEGVKVALRTSAPCGRCGAWMSELRSNFYLTLLPPLSFYLPSLAWIERFFSFVSMYFFISSLISSVISWLFSSALFNLHVFLFFMVFFPVIELQSHSAVVRKDAWYDFKFLKFSEAWFVTQDVIYPGECSVCTWEESEFCQFWVECSININ